MKRIAVGVIGLAVCWSGAVSAFAQTESPIHADFAKEGSDIQDGCFKNLGFGCAATLLTDHPLHLSVGTLAPDNGVAFGPAFVWHSTPSENWRLNGSADAVRAIGGAWRVGTYATIVRTALTPDSSQVCERLVSGDDVLPVISLYGQATSLPQISYYGLGPDSTRNGKTYFGLRETVVGVHGVCLLPASGFIGRLNVALVGEANGRFVSLFSGPAGDVPSLEQRYSDTTAPGLSSQPGAVQFGEGIRLSPVVLGGHLHLNYLVQYQQFVASAETSSFQRWTVDLRHEIPIFGTTVPTAKDTNDPNACAMGPTTTACPSISSRNRTGSLTLRAMASRSIVSGESAVPFYFQNTLGGSDLDGNRVLASYDDYRFRGPHLVLFQETYEQALFGSPIGLYLSADQGKVSQQNDSFNVQGLRHTVAIGASFRAGGLPMALFTYATGGPEGHHIAITVSPTLLGGSGRPSLQ